ncbi:C45 family autoproteolytic acyltransferase/hydolase [Paraliobacillus ryukyuensis]|uniref:C45 family autoproteolytic acyltransferase/hydolase n=1 Tax=Paraliobacillus ryukyuensis TaxID=200904 RepID=UPI0009A5779A|nr:C45 family peptidase [Paraliobacillus ryukyuensis]
MKAIYADLIEFRGNHYAFGYNQGLELKNGPYIRNRLKQWKTRKPRFTISVQETKEAIEEIAPQLWQELEGLKDGLEWDMAQTIQEFGGYRLDYVKSGCSILTGENYFIRNYDYHPKTYDGRFVFYQPSDGGYATFGATQRITGRSDGMNEKGLVMGYNFMHRKRPAEGFICGMIGRFVLETCANVTEAIQLLKNIPHRHSFSYIIYDRSGESYVVEASPRDVTVRASSYCTNHFVMQKDENRHYLVDSIRREQLLAAQSNRLANAEEAFRLLNNEENNIFSKEYKNWAGTIHTTAYFPNEKKLWIALGNNQVPTVIDFDKLQKGQQLMQDKVTGQVDTDIAFAHMDEGAHWQHSKKT